jgi:hypothetical protein
MDAVKHLTSVALQLITTNRDRLAASLSEIEAGQSDGLTQDDIEKARSRLAKLNKIIRNHSASVH